jgi:predicted flap endonuclease-1-like 5' DNA nuclease
LFWQIFLFVIVTAVLGFAVGWVTRGARLQDERSVAYPRQGDAAAAAADERDRLQTELRAARDAHGRLEASLADYQKLAEARATRVRELEQAETGSQQRIARLEAELIEAKRTGADRPASIERQPAPAAEPLRVAAPAALGAPPQALAAPEGEPDDLKKISGIGPAIEKTLHELGIYHFRQIADFTPDNVVWVNEHLRFKGRIEREDWIGQAGKLAAGEPVDQA